MRGHLEKVQRPIAAGTGDHDAVRGASDPADRHHTVETLRGLRRKQDRTDRFVIDRDRKRLFHRQRVVEDGNQRHGRVQQRRAHIGGCINPDSAVGRRHRKFDEFDAECVEFGEHTRRKYDAQCPGKRRRCHHPDRPKVEQSEHSAIIALHPHHLRHLPNLPRWIKERRRHHRRGNAMTDNVHRVFNVEARTSRGMRGVNRRESDHLLEDG